MRSPTRIVSTRRRCRLFSPWMVNPCSRVLRKLSGELTIIQYCAERPPPAPPLLRLRFDRPLRAGRSASGAAAWSLISGSSDTTRIVVLQDDRADRTQVLRLWQEHGQV